MNHSKMRVQVVGSVVVDVDVLSVVVDVDVGVVVVDSVVDSVVVAIKNEIFIEKVCIHAHSSVT